MACDAGCQHFDPVVAYDQYRQLMPASTSVSLGLEIPTESWGGATLVVNNPDASTPGASIIVNDQYGNVGTRRIPSNVPVRMLWPIKPMPAMD